MQYLLAAICRSEPFPFAPACGQEGIGCEARSITTPLPKASAETTRLSWPAPYASERLAVIKVLSVGALKTATRPRRKVFARACSPFRRTQKTNGGTLPQLFPVRVTTRAYARTSRSGARGYGAVAKRQQAAAKHETDKQTTLRHCGLFAHCLQITAARRAERNGKHTKKAARLATNMDERSAGSPVS